MMNMKAKVLFLLRILLRASKLVHNPFDSRGQYQRPRSGDAANDFARVSSDMRRVGSDLRTVADKELGRYVCR